MRPVLLVSFAVLACAPVMHPPGALVPHFSHAGDALVSAGVGLGGVHVGAVRAVGDRYALRGHAQVLPPLLDSPEGGLGPLYYAQVGLGHAFPQPRGGRGGWQNSVGLDVGAGWGAAACIGYVEYCGRHAAVLVRVAAEVAGGYEWKDTWAGLAVRGAVLSSALTAGPPYAEPLGVSVAIEPCGVLRVGPRALRFEVQVGLALSGSVVGSPVGTFPFLLSVGLVSDVAELPGLFSREAKPARVPADWTSPPPPPQAPSPPTDGGAGRAP